MRPHSPWSTADIDRLCKEFESEGGVAAPYLRGFLHAVQRIDRATHAVNPRDIVAVEAAWDFPDDGFTTSGFFVRLSDGRHAYLEADAPAGGGTDNDCLSVKLFSEAATFRDVVYEGEGLAPGWEEEPAELNEFVRRLGTPGA